MRDQINAVLIDNDQLVHHLWEFVAQQHNIAIKMFYHPDEFFLSSKTIPQHTPIYIDSDLGLAQSGERIAQHIYNQGYQVIYLITGADASDIQPLPWLKDILDKTPPWTRN